MCEELSVSKAFVEWMAWPDMSLKVVSIPGRYGSGVRYYHSAVDGVNFQINTQPAYAFGVYVPARGVYTGFHVRSADNFCSGNVRKTMLSLSSLFLSVWFLDKKFMEIYRNMHPSFHGWFPKDMPNHNHLVE